MSADALFLCGAQDEAERLCLRNLDAIDGSVEHDNAYYQQYRERLVVVTPTGKQKAYGAAAVLHAVRARVEAIVNGADVDVDDLLALPRERMFVQPSGADFGAESERVEVEPATMPTIYHAADLAQRPRVAREWIVDQWLPARANASIGGHGGSGKSMLMAMLAVCVGAGVPFYGLAVKRGPVLIYACEDDPEEWQFRMQCAAKYLDADFGALPIGVIDALNCECDPELFAAPRTDARAEAMVTPVGAWLAERVKETKPVLGILDAATDAFGGDEIRRREVRRYLRFSRHELAAGGACMLHVLHIDKTAARGTTTTDLYSGSTDWNNGVRARLAFYRPTKDDEAGDTPIRLELQKANYAKHGAYIDLRYDEAANVFIPVARSETTTAGGLVEGIERRKAEDAVVAFIANAQAKADPVQAGQKANRNIRVRMTAADALPRLYTGKEGGKRLFAAVERLRAQDRLTVKTIPDAWRHEHEYLVATVDANAADASA